MAHLRKQFFCRVFALNLLVFDESLSLLRLRLNIKILSGTEKFYLFPHAVITRSSHVAPPPYSRVFFSAKKCSSKFRTVKKMLLVVIRQISGREKYLITCVKLYD